MTEPRSKIALGCDLGATNLRVAAVTGEGEVLASMRTNLEDRSPLRVVDALANGIDQVLGSLELGLDAIDGIGVGAAAQIRGRDGLVLVGPNLGWRNVAFGTKVQTRLGRPARIVNDLSAAAWGEAKVGAARGEKDVLLVFVGSGVGGGLILGGRLYEGEGGLAGEFGHVKVVPGPKGRRCGCGEQGCLEAYVGGHNLRIRIMELAKAGKARAIMEQAGRDSDAIGGIALERAAEAGDPEANAIRDEAAVLLGVAIANMVTMLNPQKLILGGGVLGGMAGLRRRVESCILETGGRQQVAQLTIVDPALGDDAGMIGAGLLALAG